MSERPFMQLYTSDFLGDTMMLSAQEIGAYILLLVAADANGGVLPPNQSRLRRITKLSKRDFAAVWATVGGYFEEVDGLLWSLHLKRWARWERLVGRRPLSVGTRAFVIRRDGAQCRYCGTVDGPFHIDHIVSVADGGTDDPTNLTVACKFCNLSKGRKTVEEWLG